FRAWRGYGGAREPSLRSSPEKQKCRGMPAAKKHPELKDFVRTKNDSMRALLQTVEKVLDHDVNVFILGESGVGKDYLAKAIHTCGKRREKPLVRIDCAAI